MSNIYDYTIIGLGPAGIGFINSIRPSKNKKIAVIETGKEMQSRKCNVLENKVCSDCNISTCKMINGVGGASLLGGHKLSSFPAGSYLNEMLLNGNQNIEYYDNLLTKIAKVINLIPPSIEYYNIVNAKRYYTKYGYDFKYYDSFLCNIDNLKKGYDILLQKIKNTDLFLNSTATEIAKEADNFKIVFKTADSKNTIISRKIILAVGRSGVELLQKLNMELLLGGVNNHLELGIRLEFPVSVFENIDKYHKDLKLIRNNVRTFCVSKHGKLSPYYCNGLYIVDGFFNLSNPTSFTNLALMYRLDKSELNGDIFDAVRSKMKNRFNSIPIIQDYISFSNFKHEIDLESIESSIKFLTKGTIFDIYPENICQAIVKETNHFVNSFVHEENFEKINVIAPSIEYFWPDFPIKKDFSITDNIYLIGDCTGKYRGILQAFVSGAVLGNKLFSD